MAIRPYFVSFAASAQTVAVDWVELISGTTRTLELLWIDIGQTTEIGDAQEEMVNWTIQRASGSYTSGSGGSTGVARVPAHSGGAAATFTAETMNTTQIAAGSGTLTVLYRSAFNVRTGLLWVPPPEIRPTVGVSEALTVGMVGAPTDSITWVGTVCVAETA